MEINSNFRMNNSGYLHNIEESNKTGRTAKLGESGSVTEGAQIRFSNEANQIFTELGIPTLAQVKSMSTEEQMEHLKSLGTKFNSAMGTFRNKPILFDIYALMDIMQEMAQRMRDAMREIRNLENQAIQANIRGQAEIQRSAAISSMIAGAVLCGIQMGVTIATTASSLKQMSTQMTKLNQGGIDVMGKQAELTNNIGNPKATENMMGKLSKEYGSDTVNEVEITQFDENAVKSQQDTFKSAETKLNDLNEFKELEAKKDAGTLSEPEQKRMNEIADKYTIGDQKIDDLITTATTEVNTAAANLAEAQTNEANRVLSINEKEVEVAAKEFKAVRQAANQELAKDGQISQKTQEQLDAAEAKLMISRGKQVQNATSFMRNGFVDKNDTIISIKNNASTLLEQAQNGAISKAEHIAFGKLQTKLQMIQGLNSALGQFSQSLIAGIKEIITSAATELQANQKMQEDQLDQIKDLFAQELSVIQKVFQLFEAITQKESSTIENIIMA